jgi:molybdate transport system substrate-binding protein
VKCQALAILALLCGACSQAPTATLTVSAAASLQGAFQEIARAKGLHVSFNFGGSGALQKQIEQGAPADVFASAGAFQMDALESKSLIDGKSRSNFAANDLLLVAPTNSTLSGPAMLTQPSIQRIAVGNPKTVPAGFYARQSLQALHLWDSLEPKIVPGSDVRQVLDYVIRGEVDAGFVYQSDVVGSESKLKIVSTLPANSHDLILYPIAIVTTSQHKDQARRFLEAVGGDEGQKILQKHGFLPAH